MTNTQDAITAFLAKGGAIAKVDATARTMTDKQFHVAARDAEPTPVVLEKIESETTKGWDMLKGLLAAVDFNTQHPDHNAWTRRALATRCDVIDARVAEHEKALKALTGTFEQYVRADMQYRTDILERAKADIVGPLLNGDSCTMDNDTFDGINSLYRAAGLGRQL